MLTKIRCNLLTTKRSTWLKTRLGTLNTMSHKYFTKIRSKESMSQHLNEKAWDYFKTRILHFTKLFLIIIIDNMVFKTYHSYCKKKNIKWTQKIFHLRLLVTAQSGQASKQSIENRHLHIEFCLSELLIG